MTVSKTEILKKKQLLWRNRCNCCVEVGKEVRKRSFSENKAVFKKSLNMPEGKSLFEKKILKIKNPKLN